MKRGIIDKEEIQKIKNEMFEMGYRSIRSINRAINHRFESIINGYSVPMQIIDTIQSIIGRKIEVHELNRKNQEIKIDLNEDLAEFVGIMLGDGNLGIYPNKKSNKSYYRCGITINCNEQMIIDHINELYSKIFNINAKVYKRKNCNCVDITANRYNIVASLIKIGLKSGNKIKNNAEIPIWIMGNKKYAIKCLRGLIDSDGCIYLNKSNGIVYVQFTSYDFRLLNDTKRIFDMLGINITRSNNVTLQITSKKYVEKFIRMVSPIKWQIFLEKYPNGSDMLKYKYTINTE